MDKMGSSTKANNAGIPATPRDGAPIEITALLYSSICFLISLHNEKKFLYDKVTLPNGSFYSYTK